MRFYWLVLHVCLSVYLLISVSGYSTETVAKQVRVQFRLLFSIKFNFSQYFYIMHRRTAKLFSWIATSHGMRCQLYSCLATENKRTKIVKQTTTALRSALCCIFSPDIQNRRNEMKSIYSPCLFIIIDGKMANLI